MDEKQRITEIFLQTYAPYTLPDFKFVPREEKDIPKTDHPDAEKIYALAHQADLLRGKDPFVGAKIAGREIYNQLIEMLKIGNGVQIERLLACVGAYGGYECMSGIMSAFDALIKSGRPLAQTGGALSIFIAETNGGEKYLFGDRAGNEFALFCMNAGKTPQPPFEPLKPVAAYCAENAGKPEYWKTPFDDLIGKSPKELAQTLKGCFELYFRMFCLYPQERLVACSIAAQLAVGQAAEVIKENPIPTAMSIISEYGWRTAHFIG